MGGDLKGPAPQPVTAVVPAWPPAALVELQGHDKYYLGRFNFCMQQLQVRLLHICKVANSVAWLFHDV